MRCSAGLRQLNFGGRLQSISIAGAARPELMTCVSLLAEALPKAGAAPLHAQYPRRELSSHVRPGKWVCKHTGFEAGFCVQGCGCRDSLS